MKQVTFIHGNLLPKILEPLRKMIQPAVLPDTPTGLPKQKTRRINLTLQMKGSIWIGRRYPVVLNLVHVYLSFVMLQQLLTDWRKVCVNTGSNVRMAVACMENFISEADQFV